MNSLTDNNNFKKYIIDSPTPSLEGWLKKNYNCFLDHEFSSIKHIQNTILDFAKQNIENHDVDMSLSKISLERVFNMNKKVSPSQRQAIRMWFFSLYEKKDVEAVWAKIKRTIENIEHMNTTNPAAQLDIMAVKLLQKFDSLSGDEMVVLKLAISHIVDLLNEDLLDVYRAYVDPLFWDVLSCSAQQPKEEDEEDIVVREVFEKLVKICQEKPLKKAKLDIVKERAKMMEEEREDTLKYNLVLICDFLLTNIGEWANTEAEVVERLSQMLRLLFMNTKLTVKTGEVGARCTKSSRTSHEASYSGGCSSSYYRGSTSSTPKNIYGRKVDLTIRGEKKIELALCEFKAFNNATIIKKQEGKAIRLNHCVLEEMKEKNMSPKIMAFTWGGNVGEMFVLEEKDGLFVASSIMNNLIFPSDVRQINERFVNTMICFCSWRRHLVQLNEEAFVAYTTTATSSRKRKEYLTCLTPRHDSSKH